MSGMEFSSGSRKRRSQGGSPSGPAAADSEPAAASEATLRQPEPEQQHQHQQQQPQWPRAPAAPGPAGRAAGGQPASLSVREEVDGLLDGVREALLRLAELTPYLGRGEHGAPLPMGSLAKVVELRREEDSLEAARRAYGNAWIFAEADLEAEGRLLPPPQEGDDKLPTLDEDVFKLAGVPSAVYQQPELAARLAAVRAVHAARKDMEALLETMLLKFRRDLNESMERRLEVVRAEERRELKSVWDGPEVALMSMHEGFLEALDDKMKRRMEEVAGSPQLAAFFIPQNYYTDAEIDVLDSARTPALRRALERRVRACVCLDAWLSHPGTLKRRDHSKALIKAYELATGNYEEYEEYY